MRVASSFCRVLFPKNSKYFLDNLYCSCFLFLRTSRRTFIIMPTCHILLCGYLLLVYNFSSLSIVFFTSCVVVYLIWIVSFGFLSIYTSNYFLGLFGLYKNCLFIVFVFLVFLVFVFLYVLLCIINIIYEYTNSI